MSHEQPQQTPKELSLTDTANIVFTLAHIWSLPWELILRRHFGRRYIDVFLIPAAFWPLLFAGLLLPEYDMRWSVWGWWIIILLGIYHRIAARWLDHQGYIRHTQYNGFPVLCRFLPINETVGKMYGETLLGAAIAILSFAISPSCGLFLLGGIFAGILKQAIAEQFRHEQYTDMRDAFLEQQQLAERFRRDQRSL